MGIRGSAARAAGTRLMPALVSSALRGRRGLFNVVDDLETWDEDAAGGDAATPTIAEP